jgi:hypothetical protein
MSAAGNNRLREMAQRHVALMKKRRAQEAKMPKRQRNYAQTTIVDVWQQPSKKIKKLIQ